MAASPQDDEGLGALLTPTNLAVAAGVSAAAYYMLSGSGEDTRQIETSSAHYSQYGEGPHFVCNRDGEIPVKRSRTGIAATPAVTIVEVFQSAVEKNGHKMSWRREKPDGTWETCTWVKHYRNCRQSAKALMALGLNQHDSINIIGFNSWQWFTANLGCVLAGGIPAGQYGTNNPGTAKYVANHCEAKVLFLEGLKQLKKWSEFAAECPALTTIVTWGVSDEDLEAQSAAFSNQNLMNYENFMKLGDQVSDDDLSNRMSGINAGHCCGLIYTSGTTGNPKAVMMSHDNLVWGAKNILKSSGLPTMDHRVVSYLPLSHVAAQILDLIGPIVMTAVEPGFHGETWFAKPDALKGSLKDTLQAAKPTIFFGVPRVWEKFKSAILKSAKVKKNAVMQALVDFAKRKCHAKNHSLNMSETTETPFGYGVGKLLMGKVKGALGLDKCMYYVTGAAPISTETLDYFKNLDIFIDEVYGMSESGGAATLGRIYHREMGSTGPAIEGCEIKLDYVKGRDKEGNGEICFRGRNIMMGYLTNEKKTRESIDDEGYMHSGDVGRFDEHGCLYITGRIKELLITEGGENIAPVPIETYINDTLSALSCVIMIGDRRKYCSCLVSLKTKVDVETELPTNQLEGPALDVSPGVTTLEEAMEDETWKKYIQAGIDKYNSNPDVCVSRATRLQYFKILPQDLSRPAGTLGPTLKIKRPVVYKVHGDLIESMYQ